MLKFFVTYYKLIINSNLYKRLCTYLRCCNCLYSAARLSYSGIQLLAFETCVYKCKQFKLPLRAANNLQVHFRLEKHMEFITIRILILYDMLFKMFLSKMCSFISYKMPFIDRIIPFIKNFWTSRGEINIFLCR